MAPLALLVVLFIIMIRLLLIKKTLNLKLTLLLFGLHESGVKRPLQVHANCSFFCVALKLKWSQTLNVLGDDGVDTSCCCYLITRGNFQLHSVKNTGVGAKNE